MVMEGVPEDMGEGSMQCADHPYKNNAPGGICAFCLQEKLGKLVSSSFPIAVFPSSSSSSSPSFRSEFGSVKTSASTAISSSNAQQIANNEQCHYHHYYSKRSRMLFLLTQKKKKKKDLNSVGGGNASAGPEQNRNVFLKRSKSTATPRRGMQYFDPSNGDILTPNKRGFWSFLYLSKQTTNRKALRDIPSNTLSVRSVEKKDDIVVVEENESTEQGSYDRKVSRSRSVGCGSRSFSGDFFERISTGLGDCTLRRVESQREGKSRGTRGQDAIKERVKCGGLFSGFMVTTPSSSTSASSTYWVGSTTPAVGSVPPQALHARSKSWGWTLASPMKVFSKPTSKKDGSSNKNATPNLDTIPSLLAVRS